MKCYLTKVRKKHDSTYCEPLIKIRILSWENSRFTSF